MAREEKINLSKEVLMELSLLKGGTFMPFFQTSELSEATMEKK